MKRITVVGGGLAGLSTAFFLQRARPELALTLIEKEPTAGGKVRSSTRSGFTTDWAANGFLPSAPDTLELAELLGLETLEADQVAKNRFLYKNGALRKLPTSPQALLTTGLLLPSEKARAALEPLIGTLMGRAHRGEESVYAFVARHFGRGLADTFAEPFVLGITAGDAKTLSLDALFPRFRALELEHGSLVRALVAQQRRAPAIPSRPKRLTSFSGGAGKLTEKLLGAFKGTLETGVQIAGMTPRARGYTLSLTDGRQVETDALVLATPAFVTAELLRSFAPGVAHITSSIPYADVQVFGLGYHRIDVPQPLDGFGFLVPRGEGVRSLGVLYSSSLFPEQAPEGYVLLRVIAGGSLDPTFADLSADEALGAVRRDLHVSMGIVAQPEHVQHIVWARGIPQYELGHADKVRRLETALADHPGLFLTGNAYRGVGVNDTVRDARRTAERLLGVSAGLPLT